MILPVSARYRHIPGILKVCSTALHCSMVTGWGNVSGIMLPLQPGQGGPRHSGWFLPWSYTRVSRCSSAVQMYHHRRDTRPEKSFSRRIAFFLPYSLQIPLKDIYTFTFLEERYSSSRFWGISNPLIDREGLHTRLCASPYCYSSRYLLLLLLLLQYIFIIIIIIESEKSYSWAV